MSDNAVILVMVVVLAVASLWLGLENRAAIERLEVNRVQSP